MTHFIHLRNHSAYSLSEGAIHLKDLVDLAVQHKMPALALTDSSNLFGALEFSEAARKAGIQPIIGYEMRLQFESDKPLSKVVLLAKNPEGYQHLLKLASLAFTANPAQEEPHNTMAQLQQYHQGLILLTGGAEGPIGELLQHHHHEQAEARLLALKVMFGDRLYMEIQRHGREVENLTEEAMIELAYKHEIPLVATNNCLFSPREGFEAQDCLMCIAAGRYVSETDRLSYTPEHYFKSSEEMEKLFADLPEALANTAVIAERCAILATPSQPMLPHFPTGDGRSEEEEFAFVAREGLKERLELYVYPRFAGEAKKEALDEQEKAKIAETYQKRLEFEIDVIIRMKFPGYFLIVSDFIRWSKDHQIPVGPGRGSGAGSLVAWSMKITDLDPLQFGLLFERFLNPERVSMPDFDVDFCQERRDEVIAYVQRKYGKDHVAQIITFGKLQARAVVRDVGRVLQMPYGQIDRLSKLIPNNPANPVTLQEAIDMDPELKRAQQSDEQVRHLLTLCLQLEGMYRHAGTHAAGLVIGSKPLDEILPLYQDPRSEIPATQYSMKYSEMAGLVKFDFLGLKTLTLIQQAVHLVNQSGQKLDIDHIPLDDAPTFAMLSRGDSTGVFQIESAGMRDALRKMRPDTLEDLIALISLYRPGPMENIPTYIARKHGREKPDYLHPKLENCLKETYGVIIYQEQVMEIAKVLAGYSLGDADLLRRAMGKKIKAEMDQQRERFMQGAEAQQVNPKKAGEIFDLVAKFAGYGFNKSHAAAYALIGYQTAYLKANYPVEFLTACMNIDMGDTDKLATFFQEVRQSHIIVLPPDINESQPRFTVEALPETEQKEGCRKRAIRYALGAIKGVGEAAMKEMVLQRTTAGGYFNDLTHFAEHCDPKVMNKRQIESLAKAGAFDAIHPNRRQIVEASGLLARHSQTLEEERASQQSSLFGFEAEESSRSLALPAVTPWDVNEKLAEEKQAIGFYLSAHPLDSYADVLQSLGVVAGQSLEKVVPMGESSLVLVAGVPMSLNVRAGQRGRFAYLGLSDPTANLDIGVFNERMIDEHRALMESEKPILIRLEVRHDEGGLRLSAEEVFELESYLEGRLAALYFRVKTSEDIQYIKSIISFAKAGKSSIFISLSSANRHNVTIRLKDQVNIDASAIRKLSEKDLLQKVVSR